MATRRDGGAAGESRADAGANPAGTAAMPLLEDFQHWTLVMGRAQQMLMEAWADSLGKDGAMPGFAPLAAASDSLALMSASAAAFARGLDHWAKLWSAAAPAKAEPLAASESAPVRDRRFAASEWQDNPLFDTICQTYLAIADRLLGSVDDIPGIDAAMRHKLRFATRSFVDAMSPSNFALTNPEVIKRTIEQRGENLLSGLANMLRDLKQGQLTQSRPGAFEVGRDLATTPGKVVHENELYQLIQYSPTTANVLETPLVVFPPWINRYYILDLTPEKSFVKWVVDQGVTLFMVSWKSADESLADTILDDYVLKGQVDAIDTIRDLLGVKSVHAIGYCVAGTTLAVSMALLAARGEPEKLKSATLFTAQVDFAEAGDLRLFLGEEVMELLGQLSRDKGFLDGRYMAATFNLLRGRELIWNYVVSNYLLGQQPPPFDLLHWNSDSTNLPARWLRDYLDTCYRENRLATRNGISVAGTPIDLTRVTTPLYIQAGREDHIAPPTRVWKAMDHFAGPKRFVLAGSGHIAGVVNPPAAGKYQYWTNDGLPASLEQFIAGATEHKGSWWPDWMRWLRSQDPAEVPASGARVPGKGKYKAIEDAPGRYVRER